MRRARFGPAVGSMCKVDSALIVRVILPLRDAEQGQVASPRDRGLRRIDANTIQIGPWQVGR